MTRADGFARVVSLLAFLVAPTATASPSFSMHISTGGVTRLGVGQTLKVRAFLSTPTCLPSAYTGGPRRPVPPADMPLLWSVIPADVATITNDGLLTAVKPGAVRVRVECRDPKDPRCSLQEPTEMWEWLPIVKDLPGGRLPNFEGGPDLEGFALEWDKAGIHARPGLRVRIDGGGYTCQGYGWSAEIFTQTPPDDRLPWTLASVKERSLFNDDDGVEDPKVSEARWHANVTSARVTITSWKDGVAAGRLEMTTTRGVQIDMTFRAALEDRDGVLAAAAVPLPQPGMK
jgi:hypothetical protein